MSQPQKDNEGNDRKDPKAPGSNKPQGMLNLLMIMFLITFVLNLISLTMMSGSYNEITYDQFRSLISAGAVQTVQIEDAEILIQLKKDVDKDAVYEILKKDTDESEDSAVVERQKSLLSEQIDRQQIFATGKMDDANLTQILYDSGVAFLTPIPTNQSPILSFVSQWILPLVLMYGIYYLLMRSMRKRMGDMGGFGGMMNVGKSKAKMYSIEQKTGITFADVAGQDEAKESLTEMVDYLNNPGKYQSIGAKQPKGALLVGPPGTGKTLLAKAVAGEAGVPFFSLSGSEFIEMYVGVGASRVRDLFEQAKKNAPCIIFIDEIDAIGKSRDGQMMGGNDEREQTLNQLLAEMDGFDTTKAIIVLAATNRPDVLDKALLRPGRFDRRVIVEKPDLPGRVGILKVHAAKVRLGEDVDLSAIALATSGATGADLANMVNEAALRAVRMDRETVTQEDLMESVELVIAGKEKKDRILSPKEKRMVAYHEVGHALVAALQKDGAPVQKITIVPRTMGALGYTMQTPEEERYLMTRDELMAEITKLLGGRSAEEIVFSQASTGASNDIERATKIARSMVTQYGMSEAFDLMGLESTQNQYLDGRNVLTCSEASGKAIDEEALRILRECHEKARELLAANREKLDEIAMHLLEKETITGITFMEILKG